MILTSRTFRPIRRSLPTAYKIVAHQFASGKTHNLHYRASPFHVRTHVDTTHQLQGITLISSLVSLPVPAPTFALLLLCTSRIKHKHLSSLTRIHPLRLHNKSNEKWGWCGDSLMMLQHKHSRSCPYTAASTNFSAQVILCTYQCQLTYVRTYIRGMYVHTITYI